MPQDPLTQQLVLRNLGQVPNQPLPDQLSPEDQAQQDSAPLSFLRKPVEAGTDFMLSAAGIRGQKPGDLATGLGSAIGAAAPLIPGLGRTASGLQDLGEVSSPLLRAIFAKNPDARAIYAKAMATQVPEALAAKQAAGTRRYMTQANAHDALLDLAFSGKARPIPTDTGFATAIPLEGTEQSPLVTKLPPANGLNTGYDGKYRK